MTYQEVLENAKKTIRFCRACPECNGLACGETMPGPGSKGGAAHENWKAWKGIRLNVDTFAPDGAVDLSCRLFGRELRLPLLTGPIGSMLQYSETDVTVAFNDGVIRAAAEAGVIACFGDGLAPQTVPGALRSMEASGAAVIPVLNPLPNDVILKKMEQIESTSALAVAVVVDSAGLNHWRNAPGFAPQSKTVEELKELKAATGKPFLIKGIMTAKAAEKAAEAGADAIVVSNHGGRILADTPATAEVLPEIAEAVGDAVTIVVDGGIRSGRDIFKALALGADAVMICRPFAVSWFGGGSEGVGVYLDKLKGEFRDAMYMCGARKLSDICPEMVRK
ncbi:MAG: alpha-hydroxy-acid oxidizing protein [Oscillospiraceae bacterium]|nr:alpha-hydroxy-acid oxidizing protein [Oscillospiraceae bacterium]